MARLICGLLHWTRKRDSYGNRCVKCHLYWT
jgi:hypothetical protein